MLRHVGFAARTASGMLLASLTAIVPAGVFRTVRRRTELVPIGRNAGLAQKFRERGGVPHLRIQAGAKEQAQERGVVVGLMIGEYRQAALDLMSGE